MKTLVSLTTRALLTQSFRAVESSSGRLRLALSTSLARSEQDPELSDTAGTAATLLLGFLIEQVRHVVESGEPRDLERYRTEHVRHGLDGRHYSRFGDALVPVLRDVLDPSHPRAIASAWSDSFWAIVRRMQQDDEAKNTPELADSRIATAAA